MGSEEDPTKPRGGSKCPIVSITFLFLYMTCFVVRINGFFLKTCRISYNTAKCMENGLKSVPQDIPQTVTGFDLSKNLISRINQSDFANLPDLTELDLSNNSISQIDSFAFQRLSFLQWLNLKRNKLAELVENVFHGLSNLTELRISHNKIQFVTSTSFQSLTNLKMLDISCNKLQTTTDLHLILQHLPQLQELLVNENDLKNFYSWELTNNSLDLHTLDLSRNPLTDFGVTADVFPNLKHFTIGNPLSIKPMKWNVNITNFLSRVSNLDVSGLHMDFEDMTSLLGAVNSSLTYLSMNQMKYNISTLVNVSCTIPTMSNLQLHYNMLEMKRSDLFRLCVNVTELDLASNNLSTIEESAFATMDNLRVLSLSHNRLSSVPSAIGKLPNLSKLDLKFNEITRVECGGFSNLTKLVELNLQNNLITALKKCAFMHLVQLQVLTLQYNQISNLDKAFQRYLPNLKYLHLNGNKLTSIQNEEFRGLQSLLNLSLQENQIKDLYTNSFVGLINLTKLQLMSNQIIRANLDTGAFNVLQNLRKLDLSINRIKYPDSKALVKSPFSKLSHLEELLIPKQHYREKSHLPSNFLQGLRNLLRFSARNIQVTNLNTETFMHTPKLERLDLCSNDLYSLSPEMFSPLQNLKSLYISGTSLRSLDFLTDANLTKLEFLQARKNQYSVITKDVIQSLPSLVYVDFQGTSFTCDCDNADFLNWTIFSSQTQVFDAYNFVCNYPDDFKGRKLLDFDLISCLWDIGFICFVTTTCMVLCFMVMSFTYHFMRWHLYSAYYFFLAWLIDKKHQNKQAPHQYDAFISYNNHDEAWVIEELLPKLEGEQGWRLCLHHRDFEPGKPIIDNIADAIYGSRKTICVVSHRYLESEWCSREVQTASFRLFDQQKDVLILVFLEDIPTYLLSPYYRMRKLLKKQTYLSWPRAAGHPEVFWEKLRQALQTEEDLNMDNVNLNVLQKKGKQKISV